MRNPVGDRASVSNSKAIQSPWTRVSSRKVDERGPRSKIALTGLARRDLKPPPIGHRPFNLAFKKIPVFRDRKQVHARQRPFLPISENDTSLAMIGRKADIQARPP